MYHGGRSCLLPDTLPVHSLRCHASYSVRLPQDIRGVSKHAVPPGAPVYVSQHIMETDNKDKQQGGAGGAKSCERGAHRGGKASCCMPATAATGIQGSFTRFFADDHTCASYCCEGPYSTAHRQASSSVFHRKTHGRDVLAEPSTASAAEAPTTCAQAGSRGSNQCCHTPCCHTPLPPSRNQAAKLLSHPFHHTPTCVRCGSRTPLLLLLSHPLWYTTPVIGFLKSQISHPLLSPGCAVYHTPEYNTPGDKFSRDQDVITGGAVYTVVHGTWIVWSNAQIPIRPPSWN